MWFTTKRHSSRAQKSTKKRSKTLEIILVTAPKLNIPDVSREITEIRIEDHQKMSRAALPDSVPKSDLIDGSDPRIVVRAPIEGSPNHQKKIHIEIGKDHRISYSERGTGSSSHGSGDGRSGEKETMVMVGPEVSHLGWGHWYTLRELEVSINEFADENVIGEGGYGIVYRGVLEDNSLVAVKNLLNNRGQAEREFKVEVEAIGRVRHKNLVRLMGYCPEGAHRMLDYEYVDNGNLEQWIHGDVGPISPLTWDIRMNVIVGTTKGLTYLHEGLEPKIVHRDIELSNILLDKQWNPKVSDFGLAKLLGSERNYVTTRVMGTFGLRSWLFLSKITSPASILCSPWKTL